jgi:hypothetical protein
MHAMNSSGHIYYIHQCYAIICNTSALEENVNNMNREDDALKGGGDAWPEMTYNFNIVF